MAALTVVSGETKTSDPTFKKINQVTIADGSLIFQDANNLNKANLGDMDAEASAQIIAMVMVGGTAGQESTYVKPGSTVTVTTSTFVQGTAYFLGNSGGIVPVADVTSTKYKTFVGFGISTTEFLFDPVVSGVQVP